MPYDLSKPLVIGISSRALFNLEQENKIFEEWDSSERRCVPIDQSILGIEQHRTGKTGGSDHYVAEQCKHMSSYL